MTLTAALTTPERDYETLSRLCKAAGDPLRLEILCALRRDSYGVLELCRMFRLPQPSMSHHLKVLASAGLVYRRREGTSIFYSRARHPTETLMRALFCAADRLDLRDTTLQGVQAVQAERAAASREFFAANAHKFHDQQELIAPRSQYQEPVEDMITNRLTQPVGLALELGPGEGWLLPLLSIHSQRVIAIDNSAAMLEQSRANCDRLGLQNVELVLADSIHARQFAGQADLAIMNMVLHHTSSPANVMQDMATTLRAGGVLLVSDLCAHDQSWASAACGDLWLGFAPDDIANWAADAGLSEGESMYLALRNGFRVQLRAFHQQS